MEMKDLNFSIMDLERRTYRYLQQLAKSLNLPSNVKKIYLIHLIHAKKFKTEEEVNTIISQVLAERRQKAQNRKRNKVFLQNREISSTSAFLSPPISRTPKRPVHAALRYSPDYHPSLFKYNPRQSVLASSLARSVSSSDRVLRSFNLRALRKSYNANNSSNTIIDRVKKPITSPVKTIQIVNQVGRCTSVSVAPKVMDRRHRPGLLNRNTSLALRNENNRQYVLANEERPKRQRTLSGIYPLIPQEIPYQTFEQIQGVRLRRNDGRLSTINALVQKRNIPTLKRNELNIQEMLNTYDINFSDDVTNNNTEELNRNAVTDLSDGYSVYYHKKIRSEQVRYQRLTGRETEEDTLPTITDVFSKFSRVPRDVTQPLYVQVSEVEPLPIYSQLNGRGSTHAQLESLYNFKTSYLATAPLLQIATTSTTKCVYSTPVIVTAPNKQAHGKPESKWSLSAIDASNTSNDTGFSFKGVKSALSKPANHWRRLQRPPSACEADSVYRWHDEPSLCDLMRHSDEELSMRRSGNSGDICMATSSLESSLHMGSAVTIPEMVEDALEIISQDGDYMERIGMDVRVQCILCSWAGPKIILEFHLRKEHPSQIVQLCGGECSVSCSVARLLRGTAWSSRLLQHRQALYALSLRYISPDCLMATLSSICSDPDALDRQGTITIYNKVTGEPYVWEGIIQPLPPNLPYENDLTCLTIPLSKLDLLPNSANLKLHNEELVLQSPSKVVVGQPEFSDIYITLFVRIS